MACFCTHPCKAYDNVLAGIQSESTMAGMGVGGPFVAIIKSGSGNASGSTMALALGLGIGL